MSRATKEEKEKVLAYLQAGEPLVINIKRYVRLDGWLKGMSLRKLAGKEGVSYQAVGETVRADFKRILELANNKHKG